jgi:hypothetical protein
MYPVPSPAMNAAIPAMFCSPSASTLVVCSVTLYNFKLMNARQSSATDRALKLVAKGWTAYAAAKKHGLALSTIYRALKRAREEKTNDAIKCDES